MHMGEAREQWFKRGTGCANHIHLECVKLERGRDNKFKGSQTVADAGYQVLGFCDDCFDEMETNRIGEAPGEAAQDDVA